MTKDAGIAARLAEAAEEAKIRLSTETETTIALPFLTPEFSFEFELSREQLERLAKPVVARTREYCLKALTDAGLASEDLDQVISSADSHGCRSCVNSPRDFWLRRR